jgi:predicted Zn-dependent peptidase
MALGLALAARGKRGDAPGSLSRRIDAAGGRLELKLLSYDAIALELVSPPAALADLVAALLDAMADPAFAADDFPSDQFDSVMRDFRLRKLRENGDPLLVAAEAQRYAIYRGHPYSNPPFGTETSLLGLGRKEVAARWKATLASSGIMISAAGDLDPAVFARIITPSLLAFGPLGGASPAPARSPAPLAPPPPIRKNLIVQLLPGATSAYLRADFAVPPIESPDYAALSLALTMLDDIMLEELRGIQPSAYDAYSRLSPAASPSGTLFVTRAASAAGAKAGVERAISILAGGKCFSPLGSGYEATADGIDAYKSRAIARVYGRGASAAGIAERMARDLAAGGDGSSYFRMADRIAAVKAEDLTRVARERLKDAPLAWAIAGNAESIGNLAGVP